MVLVPFVRDTFGGRGLSVMTAAILLGMMILPTIISVSESSIRAVSTSYYEGAIDLGATHERSIFSVVLPDCKSGVLTGIVLGLGRAIGETMAVIMVAGNQAAIPSALTDGVRTMTTNIVMEMGYAADLHRQALIGTAVVLFVFILIINFCLALLKRGEEREWECKKPKRFSKKMADPKGQPIFLGAFCARQPCGASEYCHLSFYCVLHPY